LGGKKVISTRLGEREECGKRKKTSTRGSRNDVHLVRSWTRLGRKKIVFYLPPGNTAFAGVRKVLSSAVREGKGPRPRVPAAAKREKRQRTIASRIPRLGKEKWLRRTPVIAKKTSPKKEKAVVHPSVELPRNASS